MQFCPLRFSVLSLVTRFAALLTLSTIPLGQPRTNPMPFVFLIQGLEDEQPCLVHVWTSAASLDEGVGRVLAWMPQDRRLTHAHLQQVWPAEGGGAPAGFYPTHVEGLWEGADRRYWEMGPEDEARLFVFPAGVLPIQDDGQFDPDEMVQGWRAISGDDEYRWVAEAVVDGRRLWSLLESSCANLPGPCERLEVRVEAGDEDEPAYRVWAADSLPMGVDAWTFVSLYGGYLIDNGRAAVCFIGGEDRWRLELNEDKLLRWRANEAELFQRLTQHWSEEGVEAQETLFTLSDDCAHCHYCAPQEVDLEQLLQSAGFRLIASW